MFLDVAYGHNCGLSGALAVFDPNTTLVGAEIGMDYTLVSNLQAGVVAGVALTSGPVTDAADVTVQGRVTVSY